MNRFLTATAAALALVLLFGTGVRADPTPPDQIAWHYNFTPNIPSNPGIPSVQADNNPNGNVTFTNEPTKNAVGSSDIVATNLRTLSSATAQAPDTITGSNGNYQLSLQLSVDGQATPAPLVFTGKLGGSFSADNANVTNQFLDAGPKVVDIGSYRFTVSLTSYTPPGPQDQANAGSISAHVTVENIVPNSVPEPSTIVLSGMGLTFLGGAALRRFRKARNKV